MVKNPLAMKVMWLQSLDGEDLLEKEMATHSSILAWEISWTEGAWLTLVHGLAKELDATWRLNNSNRDRRIACIHC